MEKEDIKAIADLSMDHDFLIISDEIYEKIIYDKKHYSPAKYSDNVITLNGFSKTYAMTGWRMGYVAAPYQITEQMYKIHQYAIMCAPTTSQFAAIEALKNGDADIKSMTEEYDRRRRLIVDGLRSIGIPCFEPEGAFYVYPNIGGFGMSSEEFCERLLYEEKVAIVPGTAFGECGEGFARISYAYSVKHITAALKKMEIFVNKIKAEKNIK